jgi:hypothetical protein
VKNGVIIGFKYFGFGGLDKATKGVPAFEGIKKGDNPCLYLNLTPSGRGAFRIHVMLDGPYANSTWNGREIGVIDVPADAPKTSRVYPISVPAIEGLTGKHAIYLAIEGPEVQEPQNDRRQQFGRRQQPQRPQGLFDLHGIGFTKTDARPVPMVPQITITADGQKLSIPQTPVRSTNQNGYMDATTYQTYAPLKAGSKIEATSNAPQGVKFDISPVTAGRATVKATFNGKTKTILIN